MTFQEFWTENLGAKIEDEFAPTWRVFYSGTLADYEEFRPQILEGLTSHAARRGVRTAAISEPVVADGGFYVYGIGTNR